jgi:hypothetical protein
MRHVAALSGKDERHTPFKTHGFSKYGQLALPACTAAKWPGFCDEVFVYNRTGESFARKPAAIVPNNRRSRFVS